MNRARALLTRNRPVFWMASMLILVLAIFWQTSLSMLKLWSSSATYSHCFIVLPGFLWLVWQRQATLERLQTQPYWLGVAVVSCLGSVWLLATLAAANSLSQVAVIALVPATAATLFGLPWARALALPFAFLFLAVPMGDYLVPHMIDWTATFTVASLRASGVPVYREGATFSIPSGSWSVVEACSGIRYLFAAVTLSALYACKRFTSDGQRLRFVALAVGVTIVANWIRAYGIVILAHLSGNRIATGLDHFIYGGIFFGVVMLVIFTLGSTWRDGNSDRCGLPASILRTGVRGSTVAASCAAFLSLLIWPAVGAALTPNEGQQLLRMGEIQERAGWTRVEGSVSDWHPHLRNPSQEVAHSFKKDGRTVTLHVGMFAGSAPNSKVADSANRLVDPHSPRWTLVSRGTHRVQRADGSILAHMRTGLLASRDSRITAWHWYWANGSFTASPEEATFRQLIAHLDDRPSVATWMSISTLGNDASRNGEDAQLLEAFVIDMLGSIDQAIRSTVALP